MPGLCVCAQLTIGLGEDAGWVLSQSRMMGSVPRKGASPPPTAGLSHGVRGPPSPSVAFQNECHPRLSAALRWEAPSLCFPSLRAWVQGEAQPGTAPSREAYVARGQQTGETQRNKKKPTFNKILSEQRNKTPTLAAKKWNAGGVPFRWFPLFEKKNVHLLASGCIHDAPV